ncbi:MAG: farnesyl-diphosphate farnesyltransferase [Piptocephalis tieghemiana]|nr:MAG: farnesyl-diphosphate farnesyltransferase [Piptocephalis tieghemiana]
MGALTDSLFHPSELLALAQYALSGKALTSSSSSDFPLQKEREGSLGRCYHFLNLTSRSFASVIQALHSDLRVTVCIFYLVLRGLDTLEDDMTLELSRKLSLLASFPDRLNQAGWTFTESGPDESDRQLLVEFDVVIDQFLLLDPESRAIIIDITKRMAAGMSDFLQRPVRTLKDYNLYCHYVAGLVGIGLSALFASSGLESQEVRDREDLSNSMGLFLQKTNIIRDYLEDQEEGREFWPEDIYQPFTSKATLGSMDEKDEKSASSSLSLLKLPQNRREAVQCLNAMCLDALIHAEDSLTYLSHIREPSVFRFCAIPQVMAIATLTELFNNPRVFEGVVKIRKGQAVWLIREATTMPKVRAIFRDALIQIAERNQPSDPNYTRVSLQIGKLLASLGPETLQHHSFTGPSVSPSPRSTLASSSVEEEGETPVIMGPPDSRGLWLVGLASVAAAFVAVNGSHFATTWATQ